jgi:catechol 2,3-dioxygenase-like lactoylglutathione lyase family enzyme
MASKLGNITIDCADPQALSWFWADVFGYPRAEWGEFGDELKRQGLTDEDLATRSIAEDPTGEGPRFFFQKVPEAKVVKNRVHIDVRTNPERRATPEEVDAEAERIVGLGATIVTKFDELWGDYPDYHYVMRDPEGNEFCVQ